MRHAEMKRKMQETSRPNPGMRKSEEYERWRFMGMDNWKRSVKGNYVISTKGNLVTLFKIDDYWKWSIGGEQKVRFSPRKFSLIHEAMKDAWDNLTT